MKPFHITSFLYSDHNHKPMSGIKDSKPTGLIIGRFQPFHKGHMEMIRKVSSECGMVIIGIGSAQYSHVPDNPFTSGERYSMIYRAVKAEGIDNAIIVPIEDMNIYSLWVAKVKSLCPPFDVVYSNNRATIRLFSEAGYQVHSSPIYNRQEFSGTEVRRRIALGYDWRSLVPPEVAEVIDDIDGEERIRSICGGYPDESK